MIIFPGGEVARISNATISIDGLLLGIDLDGVRWTYTRLDGWGMGGGVETSFSARPAQHGAFDGPVYRRERVVSMEGMLVASSRMRAMQAQDQLAATLADGHLGVFAVDDPDLGLRQAQVRLSATPQADGANQGIGVIAWQIQFTAPDHRKYASAVAATTGLPGGGTGLTWPIGAFFDFGDPGTLGQITLTNDGTAATEPELTITGPLEQGFQVTQAETGRRLLYPSPVSTDVVIDCSEGTATSGGQDRTGLLTADEFFTIGPGQSSTFQFSTLGAETASDPASMTATVAPAYH